MGLVDDLRSETPGWELDRREALGKLIGAALAVAGGGTAFTTIRYLRPNVLFEPPTTFRIGRPEDIPLGTLIVLPERRLFVAHTAEGFFAMSATCTHLGCMTQYLETGDEIFCPCHGSRFDSSGAVTQGPAPRPLPRLHMSVDNGELVVDSRRVVEADFVLRA
jgi:nitrite reductase/ring-hydroxylating ferredoxin subunit